MVHIGAIVASCLSRVDVGSLSELLELRLPAAQRQWVGMGAAAGIAAAFHAPLGGILYSFEEVCSHWSARLTWRAFVCAVTVSTSARFLISYSNGVLHDPSNGFVLGLASGESVGSDTNREEGGGSSGFSLVDGPTFGCFIALSVLGGCIGALYTSLVIRLNTLRQFIGLTSDMRPFVRTLEVAVFATTVFTVAFALPFGFACVDCPAGSPCDRALSPAAASSSSSSYSSSSSHGSSHGSGHGGIHLEYHRHACTDPHTYNEMATFLHSGAEVYSCHNPCRGSHKRLKPQRAG